MAKLPWWIDGVGRDPQVRGGDVLATQIDRIKKLVPGVRMKQNNDRSFWFSLPDHAVDLFADRCDTAGLNLEWHGNLASYREPEAHARDLWAQAYARGELRSADPVLHPYQLQGVGEASQRPMLLWEVPGAGKTRQGVLICLARPGAALFVTTVAATETIAREVREITTLEPYVWVPPSRRRKKTFEPFESYLARMRATRRRPFLILGYENLVADNEDGDTDTAYACAVKLNFTTIVFDEIHEAKSHKRWEAVIDAMGERSFQARSNTTAACMELSKMARFRCGMTGTAVPDRPRDLWAVLDLIDPWAFGSFYTFAFRYCNAQPGTFGGIDTKGQSNMEELQKRLEFCTYWVGKEDVSKFMPHVQRSTFYLTAKDLVQPDSGWKTELKHAARLGAEDLATAQAAIAASQKRRWLTKQICSRLERGDKILVFGGFRKHVEALAASIEKDAPEGALVQWTHGGHEAGPGGERMKRVDAYMSHDGPAVLVGTAESIGQSINLQNTDLLVWGALPVTPKRLIQGDGRVERLGRDERVEIWYVIADGTIDVRISRLLIDKIPVVGRLSKDQSIEAVAKTIRGFDSPDALLADIVAGLDGGDWTIDEDED